MSKEVSGNQRIPLPTPAWHQTEKAARISGITLIALGALGTIASVGMIALGAMALPVSIPLVVGGTFSLVASIAAIASGIFLLRKDSWNDPVFVERAAKEAEKMTLEQVVESFGWDRIEKQHIISKRDLTDKLLNEVENKNLSYSQVLKKYPVQIKNQLFLNKDLRPLLMKEIEEQKMTVKNYKETFGDQPINDKILAKDDPWIQANLNVEIKGKTYAELKAQYQNLITPGQIKEEMTRQLKEKGFVEFYGDNKSNFYSLIDDGIFSAETMRGYVTQSVTSMSIELMVDCFGHELFTKGILHGSDFRDRFEQETQGLPLSEMFRQYPVIPLLRNGMTSREALRLKTTEINNWTFDQIIERYGWVVLQEGILTGSDVQRAFKEKARSLSFSTLWRDYGTQIVRYNLFDLQLLSFFQKLVSDKNQTESLYNQQTQNYKADYDMRVNLARSNANHKKREADRQVDQALDAYNAERIRHGFERLHHRHDHKPCRDFRRMGHIISAILLEANYLSALSHQEAVYAQAENEYTQAVSQAGQTFNQSHQLAAQSRDLAQKQIEDNFKMRLVA